MNRPEVTALHQLVEREDWGNTFRYGNDLLNKQPEDPEILYLVGTALRSMGNMGLALLCLSKALSKEQKQPNLWMHYAATLHDLNRWADAEKAFMVVHNMLPTDPMPPANIAASYTQRGKWHDALNWADKALELGETNHIARIAKGFACLSLGRWKDAWNYQEALYGNHLPIRVYNPPEQEEPVWDGSPDKTVVIMCDQGLGDQIMFAQCIPEMQKDCKRVIIECSKRMEPFFKRNFPGTHVYGTLKDDTLEWPRLYEIDANVHISLLGKWYRKTDKEFTRKAYITPEPGRLKAWKEWLQAFPAPHTGISWKGGIQTTQTHLRSIDLADLEPVLKGPGTFIDMSYMDNGLEVSRWNIDHANQIVRPPIDESDYEDTIALAAALDEVVTVTTSLVHVCGALGRSCKVLTPEVAQWRYAYRFQDDKMIWYPDGVQLYRQKPGETDWKPAINRLVKDVHKSGLSTKRGQVHKMNKRAA